MWEKGKGQGFEILHIKAPPSLNPPSHSILLDAPTPPPPLLENVIPPCHHKNKIVDISTKLGIR